MRVIAGEFRGRRLISPDNYDIRPTSDKVKEAVFSMLYPYMDGETIFVDVFSGSGGMGLEAISRGVKRAYFSDQGKDALRLIKDNIKLCRADSRGVILAGDFRSNISRLPEKADIFFVDPPYADGYILPAVDAILDADKLAEGGLIVCEHDKHEQLPEEYRGLRAIKDKRYGKTGITIYAVPSEEAQEEV